jgi:hypothetical protein
LTAETLTLRLAEKGEGAKSVLRTAKTPWRSLAVDFYIIPEHSLPWFDLAMTEYWEEIASAPGSEPFSQ